ncbi:MAG TPA: hypothetical protein VHH73_05330, partial [Verrucomicrobiae bacterium]|nr:hypothetical protein [Verrucomicrobiae bacterium]
MSGAISTFLAVVMGAGTIHYWMLLHGEDNREELRRVWAWLVRGLAFPSLVWLACNLSWIPGVSPLMPGVAEIPKIGPALFFGRLNLILGTIQVIAACWAAVSLAWLLADIHSRASDYREPGLIALICLVCSLPFMWSTVHLFGWAALGYAFLIPLLPAVHFGLPFVETRKILPSYARAIAQLNRGNYAEAEQEVIGQLEKKEDDTQGWLMLAEMYATKFRDLASADKTVRELCEQPNVPPARATLAFHQLADWHLRIGENPAAARHALDTIIQKFPDSHFARMAKQRIDQLPADREELLEKQAVPVLRLPALNESTADEEHLAQKPLSRREAIAEVNKYAGKLKRNPNNIAARESFAIALADRLGKADLAIEQLQLLLDLPDQPERKRAEWLGWIAAWH